MKFRIVSVFLMMLYVFFPAKAQILNPGFENWTAGIPDSWVTNNIPGFETVTQSNNSHSGSYALKGAVVSFQGLGLFGPYIVSGDDGMGFPVSQRFNSLKGYFQFNPQGGDQLAITVVVGKNESEFLGGGSILLNAVVNSYTQLAVPIEYFTEENPDFCMITVAIIPPDDGSDLHAGSEFYLDDLELSMDIVSGVKESTTPYSFELQQNYPNPFNPTTSISYSIPSSGNVQLSVFNILGEKITTLVDEFKEAGIYKNTFEASTISAGVYFYRLQFNASDLSGSFVETKKMVLSK